MNPSREEALFVLVGLREPVNAPAAARRQPWRDHAGAGSAAD
jgi:hypothetical protein